MQTYTSVRNLLGKLTGDSSADNLLIMDQLHNEKTREVISLKPWGFRQKTRSNTTLTSNVHNLAADCGRVLNITVTIGSTKYTPRRVKNRDEWDRLTQSINTTSNTPEAYFIFGKTYSFYPAPSSAGNTITESYEREHKDLSIADYTAGTITSITNGATTVTGTTTVWTASMIGRYIRITESDTANKGDGVWYEISSVTSATVLELVVPYAGTSIAAGAAAYTIGQTSMIPEDHQMAPIYGVIEQYFSYIQPEKERAAQAKINFNEAKARMSAECGAMAIM